MDKFEQEVIAKSFEKPVLVDFWAPWCGPCRVLGPTIEKLAKESSGAWRLVKINVDQHPVLSQRFEIRSIPSVKLFWQGKVHNEFMGALPEPALRKWLDQHLPKVEQA